MKKTYIKPEMEVVTLDIEALILSVSAPDTDGPPWGGEGSDMEADANERRGEWGNLWA